MSEAKRFLSDSPADQDNLGTCKKTAESLLSFALDAEGISPPFIIGLFGPWGSGKSSVLKLLEDEAKELDRVVTVQIDAWKKSKDSFLRDFLRGIANKLNAERIINTNKKEDFIDRITKKKLDQKTMWELKSPVKRALIYLVVSSIILIPGAWAISYLMQWHKLIDSITLPPIWVFQFALAGLVTFLVHLVITEGKVQNTSSSEPMDVTDPFKFRAIFSELVGAVSKKGKQLCISIDNLDRCEPDEAIEIMRRIKTFMVDDKDKPSVTFIVACDDEALEKHLRQCFRQERSAAKEFLRKFFNVSLRIPGIHPSDMHDFIDSQLLDIFPSNGLIAITEEQRKHLRLIVFASFSKTPRQVKQFINQLAAKLYLLRDIEKEGALDETKPTETPEVVALYLATCNVTGRDGFAALDTLRSGRLRESSLDRAKVSFEEIAIGKLHDLHLHQKIDRTLWAAIEQMKDPSNRQRWGDFADMYHAIEVGHSRDFRSGLDDEPPEDRHELIEDLFSECAYRNNDDAKTNLVRFILNSQVAENITPSRQIAAHLLSVIQSVDIKIGWEGWDGGVLASYLILYKDLLNQVIDRIIQAGQISGESINIRILIEFLSTAIEAINASQLSEIWERSLEHVPETVGLMVKRPDSINDEHIQKLSGLWVNNLSHINGLMKEDRLPEKMRVKLIKAALDWTLAVELNSSQATETFLQKGGEDFLSTLTQSMVEVDEPNITNICQVATLLITHITNIQDAAVKLQVLELLGCILDVEASDSIQIFEPNSKANLPNVLWNEVAQIEPESLVELFGVYPSLLALVAQPNKPSLAMHSPEIYNFLMVNDAIPNGWYTALIEQSIAGPNMFGQWVGEYWQNLDAESKSKIHSFVLQRAQQQPARLQHELPQLKAQLKGMDVHDSDEMLGQRYDFMSKYHTHLIMPNQINTAAGLEALLLIIDELTGMEGKIPDSLIQTVKNARDVVPHNDLSPRAKGLKIRWGKALKRSDLDERIDYN